MIIDRKVGDSIYSIEVSFDYELKQHVSVPAEWKIMAIEYKEFIDTFTRKPNSRLNIEICKLRNGVHTKIRKVIDMQELNLIYHDTRELAEAAIINKREKSKLLRP